MIYGQGNYCYAIGGIPVGTDATPLTPRDKTITISSNSGTIGATAYIGGVPVTSWSATNGSASASITVGSSDVYDLVFQMERAEGYSSTISSVGLGGTTGIQAVDSSSITFSGNTLGYTSNNYIAVNGIYSTDAGKRFTLTGTGGMYQQGSADVLDENWTYQADLTFANTLTADPVWKYVLMERTWGITSRPHYQSANQVFNMNRLTDFAVSGSNSFNASYQLTAYLGINGVGVSESASMQAGVSSFDFNVSTHDMQPAGFNRYVTFDAICNHYGTATFFDPGIWTYSAVVR